MKIAIIGAGISGLTAAWRLRERHNITVFEAAASAGGHTHTVDVETNGERFAIDTGFIVFNDRTYPKFIALMDELGVASRPTSMSFSVRCSASGLEYNGSSLNGVFAQRSNLFRPRFHRMLWDILRFNREATELAETQAVSSETTVAEFLASRKYGSEFCRNYLLPMGAAIWSCPTGTFGQFPVRFIIEFYRNHGLLSLRDRPTWRVIDGGSQTYVRRMLETLGPRVRCNAPVRSIARRASSVEVRVAGHAPQTFDHAVLACHSDQALRMLTDASPVEQDVLSAFPYGRNEAVLHTDQRLLPKRRRAWAAWNYHLPAECSAGDARPASVTYCMNILQQIRSKSVFNVTLNSDEQIEPSSVLGRFEYHHPIFTMRRASVQARHRELINVNRTSYCGAYWGNGFHEDGVVSALRVCDVLQQEQRA